MTYKDSPLQTRLKNMHLHMDSDAKYHTFPNQVVIPS